MSDFLNRLSSSSSYDSSSNLLLAAFISLLLVILFVLLLHLYAKWYLSRRMRTTTVITSLTLQPSSSVVNYRYHFHPHLDQPNQRTSGLHPSVIASIPLFVYFSSGRPSGESWPEEEMTKNGDFLVKHHLQCVICLSGFGDGEVGRCLAGCGHGFHVECIDMWLFSHSSCPVCRSPAAIPPLALPPPDLSAKAAVDDVEEQEVSVLISSASGRSEEEEADDGGEDVQCVVARA